jgi:HEAT repeat protein
MTSEILPIYNGTFAVALIQAIWQGASAREVRGLPEFAQFSQGLGKLAYALIDQEKPTGVSLKLAVQIVQQGKAELNPQVAARIIEAGIQTHILEQTDETIRFFHPLFHDYFAALELRERGEAEEKIPYPGFKYENYRPAVILSKPISSRWGSVIVILCGLTAPSDTLLKAVYALNPFLAAECIASGVTISPEFRAEVVEFLLHLLQHDRAAAVAKIRYKRDLRGLFIFIFTLPLMIIFNWLEDLYQLISDAVGAMFGGYGAMAMGDIAQEVLPNDKNRALDDRELQYSPVGEAAAIALGELGDERAIEGLVSALSHDNRWVRRAAASALASIGEQGRTTLLNTFHRSNPKMQEAVVRGLGWTGDLSMISLLLDAIISPQREVHNAALDSLKGYGEAAIPALIEALQLPGEQRRMAAGMALRQLGETALQALIPLLHHSDPQVHFHAARLIEHIGTPQALQVVTSWWMDKLADQQPYVKQANKRVADAAAESLERIGTPEGQEAVNRWRMESLR